MTARWPHSLWWITPPAGSAHGSVHGRVRRGRRGAPGCAGSTPRARRCPAGSAATRRDRLADGPVSHSGQWRWNTSTAASAAASRSGSSSRWYGTGRTSTRSASGPYRHWLVPVVVGGRHHPQLAGHRPAEARPPARASARPGGPRASSPLTERHSASPSTSTVVTRSTASPSAVTCRGWPGISGTSTARAPGRPLGEREALVDGQGAAGDGVAGPAGGRPGGRGPRRAGRRWRRTRRGRGRARRRRGRRRWPGRRGRTGSRPARPAGRSRPAAGRWARRTRRAGGARGRSRRRGRPRPAGRTGRRGSRWAHTPMPSPKAIHSSRRSSAAGATGGRLGAGPPQVEGGRHQLPGAVERHLQAPERARGSGTAPAACGPPPARRRTSRAPRRRPLRATPHHRSASTGGLPRMRPAQQQGRQLGAVAHGQGADRAAPRQRRAARRRPPPSTRRAAEAMPRSHTSPRRSANGSANR